MRRFINGILIGSLIGSMFGLLANNNMKPQRKKLMGRTKQLSDRAARMMGDMTKGVSTYMRKK
ncbi:MAG: hypothetical protein ACOYVD_04500 [Bacillota bacterium]